MTIGGQPLHRRARRRILRGWGAVALVAGGPAACATVEGLDGYSTGPDAGDASAAVGKDATVRDASSEAASQAETSAPADATEGVDGQDDSGSQEGADAEVDAGFEEMDGEASVSGGDGQAETGTGAGVDASGPDAASCSGMLCSGRCVDTTSDPSNCGGCANVCNPANVGHAECASSACTYDTCSSGFGDCDGNRANGCEVNLATNAQHCGSCSTSCSSGLCGTSIAGWSTSPTLWTSNGSAAVTSGPFGAMTGFLTTTTASEAGTIIYVHPIVTDAFTATFTIYLGGGGGGDGMGFMWQTTGATALGGSGGCLGMCSLAGYGVEFDTYNNAVCGDMNSNHVAVDELSGCTMAYPTHITATATDGGLPTLDGSSHTVTVTLAGGAVSVVIDDVSRLSGVSLPGFVSGTAYYFGFAGGTGGATDAHEVSPSLSITFPTPRCL